MSLRCSLTTYSYARHGHAAVSGLSAALGPGTICNVVGRNGSGKSTLLRLLCGIERPTSGHVTWLGREMWSMREPQRAAVCAYVPQRPSLSAAFTVRELVSLGKRARARGLDRAGSGRDAAPCTTSASHRCSLTRCGGSTVADSSVQERRCACWTPPRLSAPSACHSVSTRVRSCLSCPQRVHEPVRRHLPDRGRVPRCHLGGAEGAAEREGP